MLTENYETTRREPTANRDSITKQANLVNDDCVHMYMLYICIYACLRMNTTVTNMVLLKEAKHQSVHIQEANKNDS